MNDDVVTGIETSAMTLARYLTSSPVSCPCFRLL